MRKLNPPLHSLTAIVTLCANSIRDKELAGRLQGAVASLSAAETNYRVLGHASELYTIPPTATVNGQVSRAEMEALYTKTFMRKGGPTRSIYDAIRAGAPGGICPLCNQRPVSTLDHHLAKSEHATLAITPINLVPACKDCNTDSSVRRPATRSEQTLHPYFDSVDNEIWLTAQVVEGSPPMLAFSPTPPAHWPPDLQAMVRNHFYVFSLAELYGVHAASELVNIYFDIVSNPLPTAELQAHLREQASNRRRVVRNSWQAALYQALAQSDWFCGGGYNQVAHSPLLGPVPGANAV